MLLLLKPFFDRALCYSWLFFLILPYPLLAQNDANLKPIDVAFGKGAYAQAEQRYTQLAKATPQTRPDRYIQTHAGAALAAICQGKQDRVFEVLQQAELLSRKSDVQPVTRARLSLVLGKYHLAYQEYDMAMPLLAKTERWSEQLGAQLAAPMHIELYRSLGDLHRARGQKKPALQAYNKAIQTADEQPHEERNYEQLADLKIAAGELYDEVLEPEQAIDRYERVLEQKDTLLASDPERAGGLHYRLGSVYFKQKDYDAAELSLNEALKFDLPAGERSDAQFMLSTIYRNRGKYQLAILFNGSALDNWSPQPNNLPQENFKGFLQFGQLSSKQSSSKRALNNYRKATQKEADWTIKKALAAIDERPLYYAPAPERSNNYNVALLSYHDAGAVVPKLPDNQKVIAEIDLQMAKGALFFETKNYSRAKQHFERALELMKTVYEEQHPMVVEATRSLSEVYLEEQIYNQAMRYIDQALKACLEEGKMPSGNAVPPIDQAKFPLELLYALGTKGKVLKGLYRESKDQQHLLQALAMFDGTVKLLNRLRRTYRREGSKYQLAKLAKRFSQEAALVCVTLHERTGEVNYLYRAFDYVELAKGSLLLESIRELKARKVAQIPDSILQQEQALKIRISYLKGEIYYQVKQGKYKDLKRLVELERELEEAEDQHEALIVSVEKRYPKYYQLKYDFSTVAVADLQQLLQPEEVLLNYALMDSVMLVLVVTPAEIKAISVPVAKQELQQYLKQLLKGIQQVQSDLMAQYGTTLYKIIWAPLEDLVKGKDPIIIPDGWLNNLPFEVLLSSLEPRWNYLVYDYAMVYNYSATVWATNCTKDLSQVSNSLAGFAPDFEQINVKLAEDNLEATTLQELELEPLPYAAQEVTDLSQLFGDRNKVFTGLAATEAIVKQQSQQHGILHFATHGIVNHNDPLYSSLAFALDEENDGLLHTFELFGMELNAALVALSACNSGVGRLYEGEGMMSLARGFAYSGAPNLVTTLWPVSDQATQIIMQAFYNHLKDGLPKHQALRQAKLDFMTSYNIEQERAVLWAGIILVGDTKPIPMLIEHRMGWWIWALLLGAVVLLGSGAFWWFKRQKS